MPRPVTLVFFERDLPLAKMMAQKLSTGIMHAKVNQASHYISQTESAEKILIMPDVTPASRDAVLRAYPNAQDVRPTPLASAI